MIANESAHRNSTVSFYSLRKKSKKEVGYKRLFVYCKIQEILASKLVYLVEDDHTHDKLLENNLSIWDNEGLNIGTIIQSFSPEIINNTMPNSIPTL